MKSFLVALLSLTVFCFAFPAKASHTIDLSNYEKAIAFSVDRIVLSLGYQLKDVYVVSLKDPSDRRGPMSFGEALLVNEELHRGVPFSKFLAYMTMQVKVSGHEYGEIHLRWNPSRNLLSMIIGSLLFSFDRAYVWPQFVLNHFDRWFKPQMNVEPFEIEWFDIGKVLEAPEEEHELDFVANIVREMRLLNPEVNYLKASGNAMYYGNRTTNRTQFIFEIKTYFPGALACTQKVRTDYNPFAKSAREVKAAVSCHWAEMSEPPPSRGQE